MNTEKIKIFVYWAGDEKIKKMVIDKFTNLEKKYKEIKVIFGPTKEDDDYLKKNFKLYSYYIDEKKYGLSSDIWRFWKLSNNNGIYIDALSEINENKFSDFLNVYKNKDSIFFRENYHLIWTGIFATKDKKLMKDILNFYANNFWVSKKLTGPLILSIFIYKKVSASLNKNANEYLFLDAREIDPYSKTSYFNYNGLGSWTKKNIEVDINNRSKTGGHSYFHKNAILFEKNNSTKKRLFVRWCIKHYLIVYFLPVFIKNVFK